MSATVAGLAASSVRDGRVLPAAGPGRGCCAPLHRAMPGEALGAGPGATQVATQHATQGATQHATQVAKAGLRGTATVSLSQMASIPGGPFAMGSEDADAFLDDGEGPVRTVTLSPFRIDTTAVTNAQFAAFVEATGHRTDAERNGWSFVFDGFIASADRRSVRPRVVADAPWWRALDGADWRHPAGPSSDVAARQDHPVVHVSWDDAQAYAAWAGRRLPTEAEWEKAARGGLERARFPWGDELTPNGEHRCNVWQGRFPHINTELDGYAATAPVDAYAPNGYGLRNVAGNVWEWCADWWSASWHCDDAPHTRRDPKGPPGGAAKVMRGGSHLCHASYCNRYRVAARTCNARGATAGHTGFRCAADAVAASGSIE